MCDYSLGLVASRPAKVGDELVTTKFENSMTRGFAAIGEPNVAVCLLPGTEVAFETEVKYERFFALFPSMKFGKLGKKVAQFRQINVGKPNFHHDALEFPDGEIVLLTRLCEGQHATVLQLPASPPGERSGRAKGWFARQVIGPLTIEPGRLHDGREPPGADGSPAGRAQNGETSPVSPPVRARRSARMGDRHGFQDHSRSDRTARSHELDIADRSSSRAQV